MGGSICRDGPVKVTEDEELKVIINEVKPQTYINFLGFYDDDSECNKIFGAENVVLKNLVYDDYKVLIYRQ